MAQAYIIQDLSLIYRIVCVCSQVLVELADLQDQEVRLMRFHLCICEPGVTYLLMHM